MVGLRWVARIKVFISKMEIVGLLLLPAQLFYLRLVKHVCGATKSEFPFFLNNRNKLRLISILTEFCKNTALTPKNKQFFCLLSVSIKTYQIDSSGQLVTKCNRFL